MKRRLAVVLLIIMSLWGSSVLSAAETDESALSSRQVSRAIAPIVQDVETGYAFYRLSAPGDHHFESRTLMQDPEGGWSVLHERFGAPQPHDDYNGGGVRDPEYKVWVKDRPGWYIGPQYYYNLEDQTVYEGQSYIWSPNRGAGYAIVSTPKALEPGVPHYDWVERGLLVKDAATGDIHERMRFATRHFKLYWLDDSRLFISHFNTEEKQNELLVLDVESGIPRHLVYGTALAHDAKRGEVLFVRNEPTRTRWIYASRTGSVRKAGKDDMARFADEPAVAPNEQATELEWESLPVNDPPIVARHEHRIIVDGVSIELPHAFRRDGTLYIPVRPLLEGLGLTMEAKLGTAPLFTRR